MAISSALNDKRKNSKISTNMRSLWFNTRLFILSILLLLSSRRNEVYANDFDALPSESSFFGGSGGNGWNDLARRNDEIATVSVWTGRRKRSTVVRGIQFAYTSGQTVSHGTINSGTFHAFALSDGEHIQSIKVRVGSALDSIQFTTNKKTHNAFGGSGGKLREAKPGEGKRLVYTAGKQGSVIDAIRFYFGPIPTSAPTTPAPSPSQPTLAPSSVSPVCFDETRELLEAVADRFPVDKASTVKMTLEGQSIDIIDFESASANAFYESACQEQDGSYVELNYEAQCTDTNTSESWTIFVGRQPRCYSRNCDDNNDRVILFENYALRLTEERNEELYGGVWKCTGEETASIQSGCEYETDRLNGASMVFDTNFNFNTNLKNKKFLFLFDVSEKEVTFPSLDEPEVKNFEAACEAAGGFFDKVGHATFTCGEGKEYSVKSFPVCLGASCNRDSDSSFDVAVASQFKTKIVKADKERLTDRDSCQLTGSGSATLSYTLGVFAALVSTIIMHALFW